jgi:hypothetical protein
MHMGHACKLHKFNVVACSLKSPQLGQCTLICHKIYYFFFHTDFKMNLLLDDINTEML